MGGWFPYRLILGCGTFLVWEVSLLFAVGTWRYGRYIPVSCARNLGFHDAIRTLRTCVVPTRVVSARSRKFFNLLASVRVGTRDWDITDINVVALRNVWTLANRTGGWMVWWCPEGPKHWYRHVKGTNTALLRRLRWNEVGCSVSTDRCHRPRRDRRSRMRWNELRVYSWGKSVIQIGGGHSCGGTRVTGNSASAIQLLWLKRRALRQYSMQQWPRRVRSLDS